MAGSVARAGASLARTGAGVIGKGGRFVKEHVMEAVEQGEAAFEEGMKSGGENIPGGKADEGDAAGNQAESRNEENRTGDKFNQTNNSNDRNMEASLHEQDPMMGGREMKMEQENSSGSGERNLSGGHPDGGNITPDVEHTGEDSPRNDGSERGAADARQSSSTMKQDPNMQNQNNRMDDIGKNLQGKAEALNGMQSGRGESPAEEMKQMENELGGKDRELFSSGYGDQKVLDAGGSMLSGKPSMMSEGGQRKPQQTAENRMARETLKNEWEQEDGKK